MCNVSVNKILPCQNFVGSKAANVAFKTYNEIAGSLVHVFRISVRAVMMVIVAQMMLHMEVCQKMAQRTT